MTTRKTILPLALIVVLALGFAPAGAVAQGEEPGFEPGIDGPPGDCEWGDRGRQGPSNHRPGFGRGGQGRGIMAPGAPGRRGAGGAGGLHMALRNLDLSDSQRQEVRAIFEIERSQVEANHERLRALGDELREQIESDPYDEDSVRAKATVVATLRVEMAVLRARQSGQIRDLLTPEQLDQLQQMKQERALFRSQRDERRKRFEQRRDSRFGS